jgi:hypothetical protein
MMTKDKQNNKKKTSPTYANDPLPHFDLPNKEKGIETIYLQDDHKH